jgi:hypothetical protein
VLVNAIYLSGKINPFIAATCSRTPGRDLSVVADVSCDTVCFHLLALLFAHSVSLCMLCSHHTQTCFAVWWSQPAADSQRRATLPRPVLRVLEGDAKTKPVDVIAI